MCHVISRSHLARDPPRREARRGGGAPITLVLNRLGEVSSNDVSHKDCLPSQRRVTFVLNRLGEVSSNDVSHTDCLP